MLPSVPTYPRSVAVESRDVTSVLLSWQPPQPAYGVITGYSIGYYKTSDGRPSNDDDVIVTVVDPPLSLHYNVTGLSSYTSYQLQVVTSTLLLNDFLVGILSKM